MGLLGSSLLGLLTSGVPIGIALASATLLVIYIDPIMTPNALFRAFFSFLNKYTLMAIPFFIFAGFLMEKTGLIKKLFNLADALVGWVPGGFAYATLIASVLFGAISGSSTAMAAAMGLIEYPEMIRRGYPVWMAAGILACGGGIAILIPPSVTLILYGILTVLSSIIMFNFKREKSIVFHVILGIFMSVMIYYLNFLFSSLGNTGKIPIIYSIFMPLLFISLIATIGLIRVNEK